MNRFALAFLLIAVSLPAQETGSISGVVLDSAGQPMTSQEVLFFGPKRGKETTDSKGEFRLDEAPAGRYRVVSYIRPIIEDLRMVSLEPGEEVKGLSLRLGRPAEIHGRVLDDNGEPMPEVSVFLIGTEYRYGTLHHTFRVVSKTDDRGEYRLQRFVVPGARYAILAKYENFALPAVSDAPNDPDARRPAFEPTYLPNSPDLAGAERIVPQEGEFLEVADIRMRRVPSYCASGLLQADGAPAALAFAFTQLQPSSGQWSGGGMYQRSPMGETGPDGRFRLCDLAPGEYRLLAYTLPRDGLTHIGVANIVIADRDVDDLRINAPGMIELPGEVVWAGEAPTEAQTREITVRLQPVYRSYYFGEVSSTSAAVPGEFVYPPVSTDAFEVGLRNLADDWYVDDIEYGGRSIQHQTLVIGSARRDSKLSIRIGHDGGRIEATVTDEDGDPVAGGDVYVLPDSAVTEAEVAAQMEKGQTDQRGVFRSTALKPGKYRVVATRRKLDYSPESIRLLWLARPKAEELEVQPGKTAAVEIEILSLESR